MDQGRDQKTFESYPEIGPLLPAIGYSKKQIKDLEKTIDSTPCDSVVIATPVDLTKILKINKPSVRVRYELQEIGKPDLEEVIERFLTKG